MNDPQMFSRIAVLESKLEGYEEKMEKISKNFDRFWERLDEMNHSITKISSAAQNKWSFVGGIVATVSVIFAAVVAAVNYIKN